MDTEYGADGRAHSHSSADLGNCAVRAAQDSAQSVDFRLVLGIVFVFDVRFDGFLQSADSGIPGESQFILGIPQHARDAQLVFCETDLFKYRDAHTGWLFISAGKGEALFLADIVFRDHLFPFHRSDAVYFPLRFV